MRIVRIDRVKLVSELTKRDMTQKELAERSGISRITINGIKGGRSCTEETGNKIAVALGVPIEKLLEK